MAREFAGVGFHHYMMASRRGVAFANGSGYSYSTGIAMGTRERLTGYACIASRFSALVGSNAAVAFIRRADCWGPFVCPTTKKIAIVVADWQVAAAMRIAEAGHAVDLFSVVPVKRSHSVCAQGGINGAVNTKGEGDSTWEHFDDTVYGGDFLANQPPAKAMCEMAPSIIFLFDRMGVPSPAQRSPA